MPYCRACDERYGREAQFCPTCGTRLVQPSATTTRERPTPPDTEAAVDESDTLHGTDLVTFGLRYPNRAGVGPVFAGAALVLLSFLLLPVVLLVGYTHRVGRAAATGEPDPPGYADVGELFVDGIRFLAVLLPVLIVGAMVWSTLYLLAQGTSNPGAAFGFGLAIFPALAIVAYVGGGVVPAFMGTDDVFETYSRFLDIVTTGTYLAAFVLYVVGVAVFLSLVIILVAVLSVLLIVTLIGILFLPVLFAAAVLVTVPILTNATGAFWGYVWYRCVEEGSIESSTTRPESP